MYNHMFFINPSRRGALKGLGVTGALTASSVFPSFTAKGATAPGLIVSTAEGKLRGAATNGVLAYKGVRYGESTAGPNRFKPPVPVRSWTGVRDALAFGAPCIQDNVDESAWLDPNPASEDCLFLNVWAPESHATKRPVMVFIHGGGFTVGSGGVPIYDGSGLAKRGDVIVVTLNHRLNAFGYLYLEGLSSKFQGSANCGQLDLIEALRWVQRNIHAFGGDPRNVTIFGESGGGGKISTLLGMPAARGLFAKAIVESGSGVHAQSAEKGTDGTLSLLAALGIERNEVEKLQTMPAETLLKAASDLAQRPSPRTDTNHMPFTPVIDGNNLPFDLSTQDSRRLWAHVPLLVGTNKEEAASFVAVNHDVPTPSDDPQLFASISQHTGVSGRTAQHLVESFRSETPDADRRHLLVDAVTTTFFWYNAVKQAEMKAEMRYAPVYMYRFDWQDPCYGGLWAVHGVELSFVFDKLESAALWDSHDTSAARAATDPTNRRFGLRDETIAAWSGFARTGVPTLPGKAWPAYEPSSRTTMILGVENQVVNDPWRAARLVMETSDKG